MPTKQQNRKFSLLLLSLILGMSLLCGCNNGVKLMEPLTNENVNISAANSARGYLQAVFSQDESLFKSCFPPDKYETYVGYDYFVELSSIAEESGYSFIGTRSGAVRPLDDSKGEFFDDFALRIAANQGVPVEDISDIQVVNTKVYFKLENKNYSNDCYVVVYKYLDYWYTFELETPRDSEE